MRPRIPRRTAILLAAAILFSIIGAGIEFYYEWPEKVPGDPPSSLHTYRSAIGFNHGWIFRSSDDVFDYSDLKSGFFISMRSPRFREPYGTGGWWDFGITGIAPWFVAVIALLLYGFWSAMRLKCKSAERGGAGRPAPAPDSKSEGIENAKPESEDRPQ